VNRILAGILVILALCARHDAQASAFSPFGGFVDLARVQSEIDARKQDTFRQEFNGTFRKSLAPRLDLDLGLRYYRFDQDLDLTLGTYREEILPSGNLRWRNPLFLFGATGSRRRVTTSNDAAIVTRDLQFQAQSVDTNLPLVRLSYGDQHTFYPDQPEAQNIRNRRFQAGADYGRNGSTYSYQFSRLASENVISGLSSVNRRHTLRWSGQRGSGADGRLTLTGSLSSQYQDQNDEVLSGGVVLERTPATAGLYARDDGPDLDPLDEVSGLIDGNTTDATDPAIDIGGGNIDINLGLDLGAPLPVGAIYVYTDRPSGDQVTWQVYISEDNLTWELWTSFPGQVFNPALNRYEITFSAVDRRYIKVVNAGLNQIAEIFVTEVDALRQRAAMGHQRRISAINLFDGRAAYRFSERWESSLDASLQHSEIMGTEGDRTRTGLGWRLGFTPSAVLAHNLRLEYSDQQGNGDEATQQEVSLGYTMIFKPAPGWWGALSASQRNSDLNGAASRDIRSASLDNNLALLPGLDARLSQGLSRSNDLLVDRIVDSWFNQAGLESSLRRNLQLSLLARYQESTTASEPGIRLRRTGTAGVDWRPGSNLSMRMSIQGVSERSESVIRDILLGWNVLPSLKLSGQAYDLRTDGVVTSRRWSLNLNLDLNRRSYLYLRIAQVDLTGGGGAKTVSIQQGFRATF